jgi:hypothetical protein
MSLSLQSINTKIASLNLQVEGYSALSEASKLAAEKEAGLNTTKLKDLISGSDFEAAKEGLMDAIESTKKTKDKVYNAASESKKKLMGFALQSLNGMFKDFEANTKKLKDFLNDNAKPSALIQVMQMMHNPGTMIAGLEPNFFKLVEKATGGKLVEKSNISDPAKFAALEMLDEVIKSASDQNIKVASDLRVAYYDILASFIEEGE